MMYVFGPKAVTAVQASGLLLSLLQAELFPFPTPYNAVTRSYHTCTYLYM